MSKEEPNSAIAVHPTPRRYARTRLPQALATVVLLGAAFVGCAEGPTLMVGHEVRRGRIYGPGEYDKASVESLGREVLGTVGYEGILALAHEAGFVTKKRVSELNRVDTAMQTLVSAAPGDAFVEVFSKYAVVAGATSQADSPLPGPADVVAVGILVMGLIHAGYGAAFEGGEHGHLIGTTAVSLPVPAQVAATATAKPGTTTVAPPIPVPRSCGTEYPDLRVCATLPRQYIYPSHSAAFSAIKARNGKKGLQLSNKDDARGGPCPEKGTHYNVKLGKDHVASITCCECCVEAPQGPRESNQCRTVP
jgi:hypothetical protein